MPRPKFTLTDLYYHILAAFYSKILRADAAYAAYTARPDAAGAFFMLLLRNTDLLQPKVDRKE